MLLTESAYLPQNIGVIVSLVFFIYVILSVTFFSVLIRYFTGNLSLNLAPTIVSIVALTIASLPVGIVPIDVFIVGYMKNSSGHFHPWANDPRVRQDVSTTVLCAYYACYIFILFNLFVVIPLAYFFHTDDAPVPTRRNHKRMAVVLGYTFLYSLGLISLFTAGYFVPVRELPVPNSNSSVVEPFQNLIKELETTHLEDTFSFVCTVLRIIGIILITLYVAIGLGADPIKHFRGYTDPREELLNVTGRRTAIGIEISAIQEICLNRPDDAELMRTEEIRLIELEREDMDLREQEEQLRESTRHWIAQLVMLSRPFQISTGVIGLVIGLLIFCSLFMTNVLRLMFSLGGFFGYIISSVKILNPVDRFLLFIQPLFPLDFAIYFILVLFLTLAACSGYQWIGIGFPWIKIYKIVPWKTECRSLLALTMNLIMILFTLDMFFLLLLPQYMSYASQHYITCSPNSSYLPETIPTPLPDVTSVNQQSLISVPDKCDEVLISCDWNAPEGECVMTRIAVLWARSTYKIWYFSSIFYWVSWIFLAVVVIQACIAMFRPSFRKLNTSDVSDENVEA